MMLTSGSGELSGTSSRRKPAFTSASPMEGTFAGVMPRRMAIRGSFLKADENFSMGVMVSCVIVIVWAWLADRAAGNR